MIDIQAVFVISLARRRDRLADFQARMPEDWPLPPPALVEAVDGLQEPPPAWWKTTPGAWGCYRSHREVLLAAADAGLERVLILEDDVSFVVDFACRLRALEIPAGPCQVYLGGQHLARPERGPPGLARGRNVNRTHAYAVIGRQAIDTVLGHIAPDPTLWTTRHHIDHQLGTLHRTGKLVAWAAVPWLCGQAAGKSDVGKSRTVEVFW